ncbi:ROK family protein [Lacihabitans sp. CCS-44]|uniref:ROK family protein n=1 Tax=Lacihabitans sp. CCS-44 TaxID=2487331 RepID=UPI0020CEE97B|nr:ROK family protein [Lacihabitans sp. CCS-44]MCP9754767.1 ROK family protein [Lacihabitans sp. CCS-44]
MKVAIGIDLGGTNVKGILLNEKGEVLHKHYIPTSDEGDESWKENVLEMVNHLKEKSQNQVEIIGLSAPGLANTNNTCIAHLPNRLFGLENFVWADYFETKTLVLNDAHAALMAEAKFGAIKGYKNAILITLGTGVGGGILINGELYQGLSQMAGHLGHVSINTNDDDLSILGIPGSLEYALGNYSIEKRSMGKYKSTFDLLEAYKENDPFAQWLWLDSIRKLSISLASFINVFSPEIIILSGGITLAGNLLFQPIQTFIDLYEFRPQGKTTKIEKAHFDDLSGAIGAAAFALGEINKHIDA